MSRLRPNVVSKNYGYSTGRTCGISALLLAAVFLFSFTLSSQWNIQSKAKTLVEHYSDRFSYFNDLLSKPQNDVSLSGNNRVRRIGCRLYERGLQSCVYQGLICINVRKKPTRSWTNPTVYFVDDKHNDGAQVSHDNWCGMRYQSASPFYYGAREWPVRPDLTAPRGSCLNAIWRTTASLFNNGTRPKVRWVPNLSLVNLDYLDNDHNVHFLMDTIWLLDVALWQSSITEDKEAPKLFPTSGNIMFPNSRALFEVQMKRNVNQFIFSLILQLNLSRLHRDTNTLLSNRMPPLTSTFPTLKKRLVFFKDERLKPHDLICTNRFAAGAKLGDMGHPTVCAHIRRLSWAHFGLSPPESRTTGYLKFEQPPKRVALLDRHVTRQFRNKWAILTALRELAKKHNFELVVNSTSELKSVEDQVRFFRGVGVLVTPHGGHVMGAVWMPRFAVVVEVYPPVYAEYSVRGIVHACSLWHHIIRARIPKVLRKRFKKECTGNLKGFYETCAAMKHENVEVDVDEIVDKVLYGIKQLGY